MPSHESILFKTCLGFTDSPAISSQPVNHKTGATELVDCLNLTTTPDGCVQKVPGFATVLTHTAPVTGVSAGKRFFFRDGVDINEWTGGTTVVNRFPVLDGPLLHTPIDVRVSGTTKVYKSVDAAPAMQEALAGTNPGPATSVDLQKMPLFESAFMHGARAYVCNGRFLQYSEHYAYDLWNIGDGFIGHQINILQGGAIPGLILLAHAEGVTLYTGGDPRSPEAVKLFYPCRYLAGTLYSGFVPELNRHAHVFLCADGLYAVTADTAMVKLSESRLEFADKLNDSYSGVVMVREKYLAYGDRICVEYDFKTKSLMKRSSPVSGCCLYNDTPYFAKDSTVSTFADTADLTVPCSMTTPYSHLGAAGRKSFDSLYLTGEISGGELEITLFDQDQDEPERWTVGVDDVGVIQNKRVKLPRGVVGSKVAFRLAMETGYFRLEEARVVFGAGNRR